jgi:cytochrome P450
VPPAQRNQVLELGTRAAPSLDFALGWRQFRAVTSGLRDFGHWLDGHIEQLRRYPGEDLLSQLIEARDSGGRHYCLGACPSACASRSIPARAGIRPHGADHGGQQHDRTHDPGRA